MDLSLLFPIKILYTFVHFLCVICLSVSLSSCMYSFSSLVFHLPEDTSLSSSSERVPKFVSYVTSSWRLITLFLFRMSAKFMSYLTSVWRCITTPFQKECPSSHPNCASVQKCITVLQKECPSSHPNFTSVQKCTTVFQKVCPSLHPNLTSIQKCISPPERVSKFTS